MTRRVSQPTYLDSRRGFVVAGGKGSGGVALSDVWVGLIKDRVYLSTYRCVLGIRL
jgi:hypothetical protein